MPALRQGVLRNAKFELLSSFVAINFGRGAGFVPRASDSRSGILREQADARGDNNFEGISGGAGGQGDGRVGLCQTSARQSAFAALRRDAGRFDLNENFQRIWLGAGRELDRRTGFCHPPSFSLRRDLDQYLQGVRPWTGRKLDCQRCLRERKTVRDQLAHIKPAGENEPGDLGLQCEIG